MVTAFWVIIPIFITSSAHSHVLLIRHGEKDAKSKFGDVNLNPLGEIRSNALANLFFPNKKTHKIANLSEQLPVVDLVIAQNATDMYPSRRKIQTAEPIAHAGSIPMDIYNHEDLEGLTSRIKSEVSVGRVPLVVWDHSTIGYIVDDLLSLPRGTVRWPMDRYDVIWQVDLKQMKLLQFCQHLLFGDLWCPQNPIQVYPFNNGIMHLVNAEVPDVIF